MPLGTCLRIASASALPTATLSNVMYSAAGSSIRRSYAMTGTPACLAFAIAGRIVVVFWASTIRTLAPCEIIVSMSVACCSLLRLASLSMYLPPAASTVFWMFGLSCAAQRGCWKLFQDTPTVHPAPLAPPPPPPPPLAAGLALPEHAPSMMAAPAAITANRRWNMLDSFSSGPHLWVKRMQRASRLHPPPRRF